MNKRLNALIVASVCLLMLPVVTFAQLPTPTYGWNLGNTLEPPSGEGTWNNPPATQALINAVADAGFNTIRIPVAWDSHANQTTYVIDSVWLARVKEVVDYCYARNLYVIINCHWDGGWLENNITDTVNPTINAKQNSYWTQIANTFVNYDDHLLFAGTNEPGADTAGEMSTLLVYEQTFVDAVRATGGNNSTRWLVVQGPCTDIDLTDQLMNTLPTDPATPDRLMVEVHYYTPWQFCGMETDESWGVMFYFWGQDYHSATLPSRNCNWGEEDWVDQRFQMMTDKFVSQGIPVILGEFGSLKRSTASYPDLTGENVDLHIASRTFFDKYIVDYANSHGLHPFYWDNGDVAGGALFNRYTYAVVDQDSVNALTGGAALPPPGGDTTPPAAPTGLSATGGELMVTLNWNDNSELDLAGYNIYRSLTSGSGYVKINGSAVTSSDYIDNNVDGYVTYYYVVRAVDSSLNESGNSNQASATPTDTTPPAVPTGLSATAGDETVSLNWNDNSEFDLAGYNVYRSTTSGSGYSQINGSLVTSSDYIDNTVTNGITYYYVVTAVDTSSNESNASSEVSATPQIVIDVNIIGSWISGTTHAKEPGANRALVFLVHAEYNNGISLSSVTYGGRTMTKIIDRLLTGTSNGVYAAAFILNDANIVAADSSGTFNPSWTGGTPTGIAYSSVFLGNIDQTIPVSASSSGSSTSNPTTTSALSTTNGDMVIEAAAASSTGTFTLNNNFIEVNEYTMSSSDGVDGYKQATGVSETPSVTHSSSSGRKVVIGFVVNAPEPPTYSNCGEVIAAGHRLPSDLSGDCYVNYLDVNTMAYYWLNGECNAGNNYCGLSDFEPRDGAVDFFDFSDFAMQWLTCNDPADPECLPNW